MTTLTAGSPEQTVRGLRLALAVVVVSLIAAIGTWLIEQTGKTDVKPVLVPTNSQGQIMMLPSDATRLKADTLSGMQTFAIFGGLLGLTFGWTGGVAGRSCRRWLAAGLGLVLGAAAGAGLPHVLMPVFTSMRGDGDDLVPSLMLHVGCWAPIGAAAGLAFGLGFRGSLKAMASGLLAGLLGAALGSALFDVLGAVGFATANTGAIISTTSVTRLLARLCVALCTGLCLAAVLNPKRLLAEPATLG